MKKITREIYTESKNPRQSISTGDLDLIFDTLFECNKNKKLITEEQFDDFETAYEQLKFSIDMEIKNFASALLNNYVNTFAWVLVSPSTEVFKDSFERAVNKYSISDQASKEQFLNRVELIFQKIFIEQYGVKDEQLSLTMAKKYMDIFKGAMNNLSGTTLDVTSNGGQSVDSQRPPNSERKIDYR